MGMRRTVGAAVTAIVLLAGWGGARATAAPAPAAAAAAASCGVLATGASAVAEAAVRAACEQIGVWYTWGGGHGPRPGPTYGQVDPSDPASEHDPERLGFDCSGLVRHAYARAAGGDPLSGNSYHQFNSPQVKQRFSAARGTAPLLPGDLLAWGSGGSVHHIAIYLGAGKMVEARQSGTRIAVSDVRLGGDYAGAVRIDEASRAPGTFSTWGTDVWTHTEPSTSSGRVHRFAGPTSVRVECQKHAETVTAEGYTNDAWSYLPEYRAWITNIYLKGPAWLDGVPTCR
ncbi:NlpC/P60 family protein [Streptomyces sp. Isolate_45]|uniref:C40 family peptidase n=1 Tax=Streptomyces sp. Isolate_45 TaxID=2950111 RepID=UPI002481E9C8|nr:NlpC/P60 family protein [Streptomyces sp. Isolate_45]MDA5283399.1 NlpC/P60 family protein [Streptomyces sp. Isolate_45]